MINFGKFSDSKDMRNMSDCYLTLPECFGLGLILIAFALALKLSEVKDDV